jgi:surface polysaccharide O-acyltransferase-like enzyme
MLFSEQFILQLHFIFILGAAALIALGTFFQFLGQWNWERQTKRNSFHFWGGYGVIVIFAFNLLTGFFSGAFKSKCIKRRTPKTLAWLVFFHKYLSHGSHIVASV